MTPTATAAATQSYGEVFTRRWVVDLLLDLTGYTTDRDLSELRLLEPSCGSGAFLGAVVERLIESAKAHGQEPVLLRDAVRAYDVQPSHVRAARRLCRDLLTGAGVPEDVACDLARTWVKHADFLRADIEDHPVDVVVGNPPYIRYDDLPPDTAAEYRRLWSTMRGRGDIYVGFIERSLRMLAPGGKVGFICADRWMRNQYGESLRELITTRYAVEHVWTMHDVDAFEEKVSAYPAIIVLANQPQGCVVAAEATAEFTELEARALVNWSRRERSVELNRPGVRAHRLPRWFSGSEMWPTGSPSRIALIEYLNERFRPLHDPEITGTKVSIGVATGADEVYVTKDPNAVEADRLLPLAMACDLRSGVFEWQGQYLVNPWTDNGDLVCLDDYPRMAEYLSKHPAVRRRHISRKRPDTWYRTIDKVHASLTKRPKLLLQDMKASIFPVLEPGGHYPHHNLYYIISDSWDLEVLGGLLLSRIAQSVIEAYCVRMRGGTLRFQAQYLKRIRVPDPITLDSSICDALRAAFRVRDVKAATEAAAAAYGIDLADYDLGSNGDVEERVK